MKNIERESIKPKTKGIILGAVIAFGITSAYLIQRRKQKNKRKPIPKIFNQDNLTMERYVFNLPTDEGNIEAVIEQGGECYAVHINGKYTGSMWQDEEKGMQWNTHDKDLEPYVWEIAANLSEAFSRKGFPSILKGTYNEITATNWKTSETLEVIISEETDMGVFSTFLKDEVLNIVTFEEHLDLIVKKENDDYFQLIGIN
ncbi:hypothetical protein QWY86_04880 [Pedobacter aquatilis]|uniref:hypothetical protein n=1 Tax=Pedobacter aquatilis TaxID=351343 RepID=UPI0025B419FC|nr:hypothetical protein [Pedobacter aquatilis]MDN3585989.1 hypothetical protein [Pedobacter aquatilis]